VALACPVEAHAVLVAVAQFRTGLEAAVVARPARFAVAGMCLAVALAVVGAHVGAILLTAIRTAEVGSTEAGSVEAAAVGLIASSLARGHRAVCTGKPFIAVAHASPLLADTVAIAVSRAALRSDLCLALQANEADGAQTLASVALASVRSTVLGTRLLAAREALKANLAEAGRIVTAVAVFAVRADWL